MLDLLFYGATALAVAGASLVFIIEVRARKVLPAVAAGFAAAGGIAGLWLGIIRDEKSTRDLMQLRDQNASLQEWVGSRDVNKSALKAALGPPSADLALEIVLLPNVLDGAAIAKAMFEAFQETGWNVSLKSPQNSRIEDLRATASMLKNPRGIIVVHYPAFDEPKYVMLTRALQKFCEDAKYSKEDDRLPTGRIRILIAQKTGL